MGEAGEAFPAFTGRLARMHPLALTALAIAAATLVRWPLSALWGSGFTFITYYPAVLFVTLVAGWRCGLLATAAAAALSVVLFFGIGGFSTAEGAALALFVGANALMILLGESVRRARVHASEELLRVREREVALAREIEARAHAETALRESEGRFRAIFEHIPVAICEEDFTAVRAFIDELRAQGVQQFAEYFDAHPDAVRRGAECVRVLDVNAATLELFGARSKQELLGSITEIFLPETFEVLKAELVAIAEGREVFSAAAPVRKLTGERLNTIFSIVFPSTEEGSALVTHIDITERKRSEQRLGELAAEREALLAAERAARGEAESANRLKDEFLATLSHELRTPLANIVSWARVLLRKEAGENAQLKQGLTLIGENAMMQSHMIGELLDMSRIVAGKVTLEASALDLGELVSQCVASHRPSAQEKGIDLALRQAGVPKIVLADAARLQQVFGNLLSNAFKFTPRGGRIDVRTSVAEGGFEVTVEDSGEGITSEALPYVFERFRQADSSTSRRHGGLGLGLAIVKQLIELHGGVIRVESEGRGRGARFTVWLPAAEALDSRGVKDLSDSGRFRVASEPLEPESLSGLTVLAVEDDPSMLELTVRVLEEHGARVEACASATEALARLRGDSDLRVLVSDLGMPGMDGFELIRTVRGELGLSSEGLPALAISAYTRPEDRERALASGFQRYLTKPWEAVQLIAAVRKLGGERAEPVNPARSGDP